MLYSLITVSGLLTSRLFFSVWHASIGYAGSLNDINILDASDFLYKYETGPLSSYEFTMNGKAFKGAYILVDGIYPQIKPFVAGYTGTFFFGCTNEKGTRVGGGFNLFFFFFF